MKKLLALLMALMMCCTAFAFAEEEAEVPAVEMNVSFEALPAIYKKLYPAANSFVF